MKVFALIIPLIFLVSVIFAAIKGVRVYDTFAAGVKGAVPLLLSVFPYVATVMILSKVFQASGLEEKTVNFLAPLFEGVGIPKEAAKLVLVKPLSGSGATAALTDIVERYGADSYVARASCVIYGSSETVFYVGAVYFAGTKKKKMTKALIISLFVYFFSVVLSCLLCRIL